MISEMSKAEYYGFKLECRRAQHADKNGMRGWMPSVRANDLLIEDEVSAPWISETQAQERALEIVTREMNKLGQPTPKESPVWISN